MMMCDGTWSVVCQGSGLLFSYGISEMNLLVLIDDRPEHVYFEAH